MTELEKHAQHIARLCRVTAHELAGYGHRHQVLYGALKKVSIVVGIVVLGIALIPALNSALGEHASEIAAAVASLVLLADVLFPLLLEGPSAELAFSYQLYTNSYATQIEHILLEQPQSEREQHLQEGRLLEILRHAGLNFDDIKGRFAPALFERARKRLAQLPAPADPPNGGAPLS